MRSASAVGLLALMSLTLDAGAVEWPHWRGPTMNGIAESSAPVEWSRTEKVLWRTPLPGPAGSTPIVAGGRLFLTSTSGAELVLIAVDRSSGEELWRRTVSIGEESFRGDEGNLASPSPSTDGEHVVTVMGDGTMACYGIDGEPVWKVDLSERLTPLDIQFGYASTPIVHRGKVYLQWVHGEGDPETEEARVACLDLRTGETVWQVKRITGASKENEHSYASPIVIGGEVLATHGADYIIGHRLDNGEELWRAGDLNLESNYHPMLRFVASPAAGDELIVVPTAKKGVVVGLAANGSGREVWRAERATPDVPSPLVRDGLVYLCGENGNLTCLEAETGEKVYRKRTVADRHRASPLMAGDKLYLTSRKGVVTVVQTGREFEILAQNDMGEPISSSPVVVDGVLYLRTFEALYAIGQ